MIVYDRILERLADAGWSAYRLVKTRTLGNYSIQQLRDGKPITTTTIDTVCRLTGCQPGDLMHWEPDQERAE